MNNGPQRVDHGLEVRVSGTTKVFVSCRRQDARHVAGRMADRLVERFAASGRGLRRHLVRDRAQWLSIPHESFSSDVNRLIAAIERRQRPTPSVVHLPLCRSAPGSTPQVARSAFCEDLDAARSRICRNP